MYGIYIVEEVDQYGDDIWVLGEQFTNKDEAEESLRRHYFGQGEVRQIAR